MRTVSDTFRSAVALVVVLLGVGWLAACGGGSEQAEPAEDPADYNYLIPAGYGELLESGEAPEIFPADLDVVLGEEIAIVNEDDRGHVIGPFYVGANEQIRHTFSVPGIYSGSCSVHESGQVVLTVSEADNSSS